MASSGYAANLKFQCQAGKLPVPETELRFHPVRKWRFDFAWPDRKLAAEVDGGVWIGGRHNRGTGFERDCEKLNAAAVLGWRVLRFTTAMIKDGRAFNVLQDALKQPEGAL